MTDIIAKVTTRGPRSSLDRILTLPLALDIWETRPDHVVLRASEQQLDLLAQMNYEVEQIETASRFLTTHEAVRDFEAAAAAGYHSHESLTQEMRDLAARAPEIAELHRIGSSVEGRTIWGLRLGDRSGTARKVLLMGCHHAREWISVEVPFLTASHIVTNASDPTVRAWLTQGEVWVVPMVNPDGHVFTMAAPDEEHRLWRKNRRPNPDGSVGVDPNRNYGHMWGSLDISTSSRRPGDETYIGPSAFSEPETRAVRDLVTREGFQGLLTYHSYSQLILHPWGHTHDPIVDAADRERMRGLSERMRLKIRDIHGVSYTAKQASGLYPTAGDTTDWAYWTYRIPALTIELRPKTVFEGGFILSPDQIRPTWEENWPAAVEFINAALLEPAPALTHARAATAAAGATSRLLRHQSKPQNKELSMKLMSYTDGAAAAPQNGARLLNGDELQPVPPPRSFEMPQFGIQLEEVRAFIRLQEARQTFNVTGAGLAAAVIDTGVRKTHIDFDRGARVPVERNFTSEHGGDPTNAGDTQGHGTNVAGIIAANGNHRGIAPGAKIVPLKVLDAGGGGSFEQIFAALEWLRDNHRQHSISAACMSLGGRVNYTTDDEFTNTDFKRVLRTLRDERVAVVISAGNDFFTHDSRQGMSFPAIIRESISVGAVYDTAGPGVTYQSGARAFRMVRGAITPFSQRLHESVNPACRTSIFAPGAPVTSSGFTSDTGESVQHGTSQAAPVTVGVILLMQEYYRRVTGELPEVDLLVDCLRSGGVRLRDGDDEDDNVENTNLDFLGINAYSALEAVRESLEVHLLLGGASFVS